MFANKQILEFIEKSINQGLDLVGTSVIKTLGSTYAKSGNMIFINSKGESVGVLGSPYLHEKIYELSKKVLETKKLEIFESIPKDESTGHGTSKFLVQPFFNENNYGALGLALNNFGKTLVRSVEYDSYSFLNEKKETKLEDNMFFQTIERPYSLLIFGSASHVTPVISMANLMGWKTTVIDLKINKEFVNEADELIQLNSLVDIKNMDLNLYDTAVILSHSPKTDDFYLKALVSSDISYIGMMGNKKNMKRITQEFNLENDTRFFAPIGLNIGGNTHQSVALSICAQIEARKNKKI